MKKIISFALCLVLSNFVLLAWAENNELNVIFKEKIYTPNTQISELIIDVQDKEIEVSVSKDKQVHIQYSYNDKEYYDISVSGNVLTMTSVTNKKWTDYIGFKTAAKNRKIMLYVPDSILDNLSISTTNDDVLLSALAVKDSIRISTNNGTITFENLHVGNALKLDAKNGNISGTITGSYDDFAIQSTSKKGESNLPKNKSSGNKTLEVSCNNGDITIEFVRE